MKEENKEKLLILKAQELVQELKLMTWSEAQDDASEMIELLVQHIQELTTKTT